ncbi:SDR family oxidoreductase [Halieaceae bacterium IMCC14734]|uniref:SDR family oxidoreductase n=1 Tax=Candidatus Litorirhabdus singularis TaxID=2518993 RepID=A0ABT3TKN8_9GAMM|nr:SDR family oxidoreductase [Candidatus Litorirhabdus singularis]MCX2982902.1 SDR family oxidoreductase [Candidatus Litorirhabdus singularis]
MTTHAEPDDVTLVFGASGYIGSNLVPFLSARGKRVRAVSRNRAVLEGREWPGVECAAADALDPDSLAPALQGVHTAYYLVHSMAAGSNFGDLDLQAAANFRDAAALAEVKRIVYLGGLIPHNPESLHLQSRYETGEVLRSGSVPITEVRAGMIIGPGSAAFEVMRDLVNNLPVMITPRWVYSLSPPIALPDLLAYLAGVADLPAAAGQIYDAAGPDVLTYADIMRRLAKILGRKIWILPVPVLTPKLSSHWLGLVTTVPTNIARALVDGLKHDVLADDTALRALVPIPLLALEEAILDALAQEANHDIPAHWVEGSIRCRNFEPRYAYYAKQATGSCQSSSSPTELWQQICRVGNDGDFFALNTLWWLRRAGDWLVGGPSFRRRRRDPDNLRVGDVVDAWRVIALQPQRKLTLLLEMKLPGAGVLEFDIIPNEGSCEVRATAYFHPAGVWGLLYWYPLVPFHLWIFKAMSREIVRRASLKGSEPLVNP